MFQVIEPQYHCFHKARIDSFVGLLKEYQLIDFSFEDQNNSTFILVEHGEEKVFGGALLLKKEVRELQEDIRKKISSLAFHEKFVWKCSVILHIANKDVLSSDDEFELFFQTFYRALYQTLVEFGNKKDMGFLYIFLDPGEYLCTEQTGLWPYVIELKPQESLDGLFHL